MSNPAFNALDSLLARQRLYVVPRGRRLVSVPGNINLLKRPHVRNPDGSVSSVRSVSFSTPKGEVLVPTVIGNRVVSNAEAWNHYVATGQHLGIFRNAAAANRYSNILHLEQASLLKKPHMPGM